MPQTDSFFLADSTLFIASAPGRMDVMGGIADYSGSLVLQMPIREKTTVTLALRNDFLFHIRSNMGKEKSMEFSVDYQQLLKYGQEVDYTFANQVLKGTPGGDWAAYVVGCFLVLQREKGIKITGADVLIESDVPVGKGVSSSAALEVATLKALQKAYNLTFLGTELPVLAQKVENRVVGAPCGLMDQLASYFGEPTTLLPILCQPDILQEPISIPTGIRFVGIDSGAEHAVVGASYSDVRTAAFMGYTVIATQVGATPQQLAYGRNTNNRASLPYGGYLANVSPSDLEDNYVMKLPYKMSGRYFIDFFPEHVDPFTTVDPEKFYAVLNCTRHPVYENFRVKTFSLLMEHLHTLTHANLRDKCLQQMGELMYQSHVSYTACGLGHKKTDQLVQMIRQHRANGVYGAKITGGGSGGTVCILCDGDKGVETAYKIYQDYKEQYQKDIVFFAG